MAEHPQMCELVDDHRFERFGWGEDQPPRECEATPFRGTPPSASLIANADRGWSDLEAWGVTMDLTLDFQACAWLEPGFEDGRGRTPVRLGDQDDDLVLIDAADTLHARAAPVGIRRPDAEPMEIATETDLSAIAQTSTRSQLGSVPRVPIEMSAEPRFAIDQERTHMAFGIGPAAPPRRRHRNDDAPVGVDHHPKAARPRRTAERVVESAAGQAHGGGGLRDDHHRMVPRRGRGCASGGGIRLYAAAGRVGRRSRHGRESQDAR